MIKIAKTLPWALLLCVLLIVNRPAPSEPIYDTDAPIGPAVGQQAPDFTLSTVDGGQFSLREHRGKVTVLNLWATWCGPCVKELPNFDRLAREQADEVAVLAIHSDLITDDVGEYLARYDYDIPFAVDASGQVITSLGGSQMLPQTIVLDPYGVVTYNQVGSVSYELLTQLVDAARHPQ